MGQGSDEVEKRLRVTLARLGDDLGALGALILGLALLCWPALQDGRRGLGQFDTSFTHLATEHLQDVLLHGAPWRDAPLVWPLGYGTANADWQAGEALLGLPLRMSGVDPSRAALLLAFAGVLLSGFLGHRLARALLGVGPHTWLAGALIGLNATVMVHLQHVNLIHHELMFGGLLALGLGLERDRPGLAGLGGVLLALSFHLGIYMGVHAVFAGGGLAAAAALAGRGARRTWGAAAAGAAVAGLTVLPVLGLYHEADQWLKATIPQGELENTSWDPTTLARPNLESWLYGRGEGLAARMPGNPGFFALALAVVGAIRLRDLQPRWAWGAVVAVGVGALLLALGPEIRLNGQATGVGGLYPLLDLVPGLSELREPHRWTMLGFMATGLLSAAGLQVLLGRVPAVARAPAILGALLLVVAETPRAGTTDLDRETFHPVYQALYTLPREGAVWENLLHKGARACMCSSDTLMRAALLIRRPLFGLQTARQVPAVVELKQQVRSWPSWRAGARLATLGVVAVVDHPPYDPAVPDGWTCQPIGDHRLCVADTSWTPVGTGHPPPYTGLGEGDAWLPALPVRAR